LDINPKYFLTGSTGLSGFFHGFHLPAIASSSEAGGDEAEKTQFRFSEKRAEESAIDAFSLALLFYWRND
jgi:hypothetical protein